MTDTELADKKLRLIEELVLAGRTESVQKMAAELIAKHPETDAAKSAKEILRRNDQNKSKA